MQTMVKTKKWGHSIGVVLPTNFVKEQHIKPGEQIIINVEKKTNVLRELFGALPELKDIDLKEIRKELDSKYM